ncbi:MAG: hypothetical protein GX589_11375 [Deltaproteobacteria bacterium]|nr:hypothetical protein [Deltaproteobacteria bacterium]
MPVYEYIAINSQGKTVKGSMDAEGLRAARQRLRGQNLYPTDIKESTAAAKIKTTDIRKYFRSDHVSLKSLGVMTRQMATLLGAGLPLVSALHALSEQTDSAILQQIVVDVKEDVEEGASLAKALGKYPKTFPRLYVNMVAAGEASGTLDTVLVNLADHLESQVALRSKVQSALIYPALMLLVCAAVIIGLFVFVIPNIVEIFEKQGAVLPLPTRITIAISDFNRILVDPGACGCACSFWRTRLLPHRTWPSGHRPVAIALTYLRPSLYKNLHSADFPHFRSAGA